MDGVSGLEHLYDVYAWATKQVSLLSTGRFGEADIPNIVSLLQERADWEKNYTAKMMAELLRILLLWQFASRVPSRHGQLGLAYKRAELVWWLQTYPGLQTALPEICATAYGLALLEMQKQISPDELHMIDLPATCPWTVEQVLDEEFLPLSLKAIVVTRHES